ncbi:MAG: hypothetical protein ACI8X5_002233 [Planctomycetota bacterium]|jgi:hypothetical protein
MGFMSSRHKGKFGPFAALLAAQILFITLVPFVDRSDSGDQLQKFAFYAVMIVGIGVTRESRKILGPALLLLTTYFVVREFADSVIGDEKLAHLIRGLLGAAYLGYLTIALMRTLSRRTDTTTDVVLGGINIYLLFALIFMLLHLSVEEWEPGSYMRAGLAMSDPDNLQYGNLRTSMFYFSFSTLTTLGYGDIAPARPIAQFICSAQAVIGQLYVAISIGGLVAMRVNAMHRQQSKE